MHITPPAPTMTIARVRELADEMGKATSAVVCSFTREQLVDLLAEIDQRTRPAVTPAAIAMPSVELTAISEYASHRRNCDRCGRGGSIRCDVGQALYTAACAALVDQARNLL